MCTDLILFNKSNKRRSFDFNRLSCPIIQSDNEMKEVGFAKVAGWLLFEVSSTDANAAKKRENML